MKQIVPKHIKEKYRVKAKKTKKAFKKTPFYTKPHEEKYGTSQLEKDFARNFLDKMGIVYIYQYEAKDIKRFFDFAVTAETHVDYKKEEKDGISCVKQDGQLFIVDLLIEIDGSYYHADKRVVSEDKIRPMHRHNMFVDGLKTQWAGMHCIPLLRIWEYDIRHNPQEVKKEIAKYINIADKTKKKRDSMKKPH